MDGIINEVQVTKEFEPYCCGCPYIELETEMVKTLGLADNIILKCSNSRPCRYVHEKTLKLQKYME